MAPSCSPPSALSCSHPVRLQIRSSAVDLADCRRQSPFGALRSQSDGCGSSRRGTHPTTRKVESPLALAWFALRY
ncbi:hypothetical protein GUJ93_ZPchr0003g16670 [Zizania palustris]|uniref:Uncharacterized protein n=1 Tax=Zizania palustris TaxID=103762 RepID=A0A8J5STR3_ZIZPA|nr:hypothetical protein GUJ93_ZPchr0003g16670 [Zizania palustris]